MVLMSSPLDQLRAGCNLMKLFSLAPLHGGNMVGEGVEPNVVTQVDVVEGMRLAEVKQLCLM